MKDSNDNNIEYLMKTEDWILEEYIKERIINRMNYFRYWNILSTASWRESLE